MTQIPQQKLKVKQLRNRNDLWTGLQSGDAIPFSRGIEGHFFFRKYIDSQRKRHNHTALPQFVNPLQRGGTLIIVARTLWKGDVWDGKLINIGYEYDTYASDKLGQRRDYSDSLKAIELGGFII